MNLHQKILNDPLLSQKYEVIEKLGQGCFGKIYKVKNKLLKLHTALKLEISQKNSKKSMLENQAEILKTLKGKALVPQFYALGQWTMGTYIEIELLNKDLNSLAKNVFSPQEIDTLTVKLLHSLSVLHKSNIIHQDIKPQNIMINQKGEYVFIDFGISKKLINNQMSSIQMTRKRGRGFIGTPRYASIAAHKGMQQSKKDDLESLMYNIGFLYLKRLPWLSLKVSGCVKINEIKVTKMRTAENVFQQMGMSYSSAFSYIKSLQYMQEPNYKYLISLFKRNQSIIIEPIRHSTVKSNHGAEGVKRNEKKKFSLNNVQTNGQYLKLPLEIRDLGNDLTFGGYRSLGSNNNSRNEMGSTNGSKGVSMVVFDGVDEITDAGELESFEETAKMNDVDDKQPAIPNISKFFSPLNIKNPFRNNR